MPLGEISIAPGEKTILITHGWDSNIGKPNFLRLMEAASKAYPDHQVLGLDWSGASNNRLDKAVGSITPVAYRAAKLLIDNGVKASDLSIFGHSLGSYVAAEIGKFYIEKQGEQINSIVALDPANGAGLDTIGITEFYDIDGHRDGPQPVLPFWAMASKSTAFVVSSFLPFAPLGNVQITARDSVQAATANSSFSVNFNDIATTLTLAQNLHHSAITNVFSSILEQREYGFSGYTFDSVYSDGLTPTEKIFLEAVELAATPTILDLELLWGPKFEGNVNATFREGNWHYTGFDRGSAGEGRNTWI